MRVIGGKNMNWIDELRNDISAIRSSPRDLRKFGVIVGSVFVLLTGFAFWKEWWSPIIVYAVGIAGFALIVGGLIFAESLRTVHRYWMGLAIVVGSIVSRIILFLLFFLVLTPLAMAAKVFGKKFFISYRDTTRSTYWIQRDRTKPIHYERMF